jgi:hypothetical protein
MRVAITNIGTIVSGDLQIYSYLIFYELFAAKDLFANCANERFLFADEALWKISCRSMDRDCEVGLCFSLLR